MPVYRERLWPSVRTWLLIVGLSAMAGLMGAPFGLLAALAVGVIALLILFLAFSRAAATVSVDPDRLVAGHAHIERSLIAGAAPLSGEAARQALGPDLDARAYLLTRPWVRGMVRIDIDDPADPTPYWLVSSRRPERLAEALGAS